MIKANPNSMRCKIGPRKYDNNMPNNQFIRKLKKNQIYYI